MHRITKRLARILIVMAMAAPLTGAAAPGEFTAIDRHVEQTPAAVTRTVPALTAYLIKPAKTDREKVRALYYWIARNVSYDVGSLADFLYDGKDLNRAALEAETVLKKRTGVCGGLAALFMTMAREAGLEADMVLGWFRGTEQFYDGKLEKALGKEPNHAWNRVTIDGRWHLLDLAATVGWTGSLSTPEGYYQGRKRLTHEELLKDISSKKIRFTHAIEWHFFLTPPDRFIYTHFPADAQWQLLDKPRSRKEFEEQAFRMPAYFKHGLTLLSPPTYRVTTKGPLTVRLTAPATITLYAVGFVSGNYAQYQVFTPRAAGEAIEIPCAFAARGTYQLYIYVKDNAAPKLDPQPALLYVVTVP